MNASVIINVMCLILGIKFQSPVKKLNRSRSLKYRGVAKVMAKTSKNNKSKSKSRPKYSGGRRLR